MKRFLFSKNIILLIPVAILFYSCTKENTTKVTIINFDILQADWVEYGTPGSPGHSYQYTKTIPEITTSIVDKGSVTAYLYSNPDYYTLPYLETSTGNIYIIEYHYAEGSITLVVEESDLYTSLPDPITQIKVVIIST